MVDTRATLAETARREVLDTLIIGAGPAGLATAACLKQRHRSAVIVERADAVGASWRRHYERLHLHTMKQHSCLPHMPFPEHYPTYPSRAQVVEYLDAYAERFGLSPRFNEEVTGAHFHEHAWEVTTNRRAYLARHLVVATGYNRTPKRPRFEGEEDFEGQVLHSRHYRSGAAFRGQRVLIVGSGNSGAEIALDLWESGAKPGLVVRSPRHIVPRDLFGIPSQLSSLTLSRLPRPVMRWIAALFSRFALGDLSAFGLLRPDTNPVDDVELRGRIPMIDVGTVALIRQRELTVYPAIERLLAREVLFSDGRKVAFDAIVLATGYAADLSYLDHQSMLTDERGYPTTHGGQGILPRIYFLGYRNPITGALNDIAREAERVAEQIDAHHER